ncbi:MAG: flagellar FlbD family protein [Armatimonadetes bacterium]|nr:flagellar FlbD family protein [Armatimonadota bacterium]MCX7969068.1 flagellar FlbD family protein [Armatimonadota bacterium]MDW8142928.1 flagellar FlbD family protein [Armatimonadota bacterium]
MILVHRLDGAPFYLNAELVETIEATPDTVIVLVNGHKYIVREPVEEVISRILNYRRFLLSGIPPNLIETMQQER